MDGKSRMSGDVHVRFREGVGVRLPRATRRVILVKSQRAGLRVMASVARYLEKLKVKVNAGKSNPGAGEFFPRRYV